jgi:signal transduction histidine kinase
VVVTDEGRHPPSDRERIFERFHRLDPQPPEVAGGTVLGHATAREGCAYTTVWVSCRRRVRCVLGWSCRSLADLIPWVKMRGCRRSA